MQACNQPRKPTAMKPNGNTRHSLLVALLAPCALLAVSSASWAQGPVTALASPSTESRDRSPVKKDGWIEERDDQSGTRIMTMELLLHPAPEPRPALRYHLIPNEFERIDGNAALFYLKAMGFLEQNTARDRLEEFQRQAQDRAQTEGEDFSQFPPESWRATPPAELPIDEVKEYLKITDFQPPLLREAAQRDRFDMERNIREVDNVLGFTIPEMQLMRELARTQDLRCRLAMAENRMDDAITILGQQYAMARHLSQDDFLISSLVGMAISHIAFNQALHLVQHPQAPNLYWAYAALPRPLADTTHSMSVERQLLFEEIRMLREVDETARSVEYWSDFVDRLAVQMETFGEVMGWKPPDGDQYQSVRRAALVAYIATCYPGARQYLAREWNMSPEQLDSYPTAQVVFLAVVRFYEQWRDEYFKWMHLPWWQARSRAEHRNLDQRMRQAADEAGFCAMPTLMLLPALSSARAAESRTDQMIALVQTVEAIRMYGAVHDGQLPRTLQDLPVPAPLDPATGEPIEYEFQGEQALLSGSPFPAVRYRLIVRFADTTP